MKKKEKIDLEKTKFVNSYNNGEIQVDEFVKKVLEIKSLNRSFMGIGFMEIDEDDEAILTGICNTNGIVLNQQKKDKILNLVKEESKNEY